MIPLSEPRNRTKARVLLDEREGRKVVVKTVEGHSWLRRALLSGPLLRREARALGRLRDVAIVPTLLLAHRDRIELEWIAGRTLSDVRQDGIEPAVAASVRAVVAEFHALGWAHGDLGARDVMVCDDGSVVLLDLATAVGRGFPTLLWRLLLPIARSRDVGRIEKIVERLLRKRKRRERQERRAG